MSVDHPHRHTPDEETRIRDAALDQTLEGTFPASDPLSSLPNPDDDQALEHGDAVKGEGDEVKGNTVRKP